MDEQNQENPNQKNKQESNQVQLKEGQIAHVLPQNEGNTVQPSQTEGKAKQKGKDTARTTGKTGPMNQAEREDCLNKIQIGVLHGTPPKSVWLALGIHRTTYYRLLGKLGEETRRERLKQSGVLLHTYLSRTEASLDRLDEQYLKAETPRDKAAIQSEINTLTHQTFDRLQSAGFIPKRADKLELEDKTEKIKNFMGSLFKKEAPKQEAKPG